MLVGYTINHTWMIRSVTPTGRLNLGDKAVYEVSDWAMNIDTSLIPHTLAHFLLQMYFRLRNKQPEYEAILTLTQAV